MSGGRRYIFLITVFVFSVGAKENVELQNAAGLVENPIQISTPPSLPSELTNISTPNEPSSPNAPHDSHNSSESRPEEYQNPLEVTKNPLIVEISTGKIEGFTLQTEDLNKDYYAYRGIPYAKPPVENLRFREPVPAEKWHGTLKALDDGPKCIQFESVPGKEDCLYLNVFSPKNQNPILGDSSESSHEKENLLPVMVWIYGGSFTGGSANIEKFGPDYFINEDVIIVTFNYRVGVFGFLSTEDYAAPGNWGLKDQILALKWVQENIEKFGGSPKNVTLFGQSAGAACVSILTQSPLSRGLFHKAIMQSGTSLNMWAQGLHPRKSAMAIGRILDIHTNDTTILIEQLRKVDYRTLHVVSLSADLLDTVLHNPLNGLVFAPTTEVNHPGAVLANNSHSILKNGDFSRVPVIVGFDSEEAVGSIDALTFIKPYVVSYDLFSTRLVPSSLNIERNLRKVAVAQLIRMQYFGWRPIFLSNHNLVQFLTDDQFVRPIYEYIRQSSKYAPTYFYVFSYEGPLGSNGKKREYPGVGHSEENNYIWNRETNINNAPSEDILTRRRLVRMWTNFAKTGNPTPVADTLLENATWPPTNIKTMVYLNINKTLELGIDVEKYNIQFWDEIFLRHGNPPYDTY